MGTSPSSMRQFSCCLTVGQMAWFEEERERRKLTRAELLRALVEEARDQQRAREAVGADGAINHPCTCGVSKGTAKGYGHERGCAALFVRRTL